MRFYLGTHQPSWLARGLGVPFLVSHRRLAHRRTLPRATSPWALDSGGFTELSLHGRWRTDAADYVKAVRRYANEVGNLDWAAPRDRMTEEHVLERTGLSLRTHQYLTVVDYLRLRDLDPELPFIPVLQGQSVTDYHRCADMYEQRGIDLAALPLVGVGSVCRRQHTTEVERIVRSLAAAATAFTPSAPRCSASRGTPTRSPPATPPRGVCVVATCRAVRRRIAASQTACGSRWNGTHDCSRASTLETNRRRRRPPKLLLNAIPTCLHIPGEIRDCNSSPPRSASRPNDQDTRTA